MHPEIIQAESLGFCMGVRRAIDRITAVALSRGGVETLGALVHNQQVLNKLAGIGVDIVDDASRLKGDTVVISAHGVSPRVMDDLKARGLDIIDTTCPFVRRAQMAARKLAEAGFYTLVYGNGSHPEVKGILGWAQGNGMATQQAADLKQLEAIPLKLGVVSQTTQIPSAFRAFAREVIDLALVRDAEIRIVDTLCHDIRRRQADALVMARSADLVLVIGGRSSANTRHLFDLCSTVTETHLIETEADIDPGWLEGKMRIGVTAGASTDDETIARVNTRLKSLAGAAG